MSNELREKLYLQYNKTKLPKYNWNNARPNKGARAVTGLLQEGAQQKTWNIAHAYVEGVRWVSHARCIIKLDHWELGQNTEIIIIIIIVGFFLVVVVVVSFSPSSFIF